MRRSAGGEGRFGGCRLGWRLGGVQGQIVAQEVELLTLFFQGLALAIELLDPFLNRHHVVLHVAQALDERDRRRMGKGEATDVIVEEALDADRAGHFSSWLLTGRWSSNE